MTVLALLLALGETYLTRDEALKLVFPSAERVVERAIDLDPGVRDRVQDRYGGPVSLRQQVFVGLKDGAAQGFAMIYTEITKTLPATFIVGINLKGEVTEVAVLSHEDHIGSDCKRPRFLEQFQGKTVRNQITVPNGGIQKVGGATLSCIAVARAVRKGLAIAQHHFLENPENLRAVVQEEAVRQKRYVMGSFCEITAYGDRAAVETAFDEIKRLDKVLSNYDEKSELSRLNRERSLRASPDLLGFVKEAKKHHQRSGGAFDVTVAPLVRLWGFKDGKHRVPSDEEIRAVLQRVGSARIEIDGETVRLPEGMELDPGAIGKGIAVDRAADVLRKAGIIRALVDFGSSIVAIGTWEVGLRDPFAADKIAAVVTLKDESVSTSGNYEKFFTIDGKTYGHILDPRTGRPVGSLAGVSVIAPTGTESDALSTAVYVRNEVPADAAAILISVDGEKRMNDAFRAKLKKGGQ